MLGWAAPLRPLHPAPPCAPSSTPRDGRPSRWPSAAPSSPASASSARASRRRELQVVTSGDRITDRPLADIGGKGLFVKEIEEALLDRRADFAVHSIKDVPGALPDGLLLACVPRREDPRDVLVAPRHVHAGRACRRGRGWAPPAFGAWSRSRPARPDLEVVPLRGNVDTRLRKVDAGECDAIVLARAGLVRLGLEARATRGAGARGVAARRRAGRPRASSAGPTTPRRRAALAASARRRTTASAWRPSAGCSSPSGATAGPPWAPTPCASAKRIRLRAFIARPDGSDVAAAERRRPGRPPRPRPTSSAWRWAAMLAATLAPGSTNAAPGASRRAVIRLLRWGSRRSARSASAGRRPTGKALLEGEVLMFRGDLSLQIPFEDDARRLGRRGRAGRSRRPTRRRASSSARPSPTRWARLIKEPKGLFEKLEVGPQIARGGGRRARLAVPDGAARAHRGRRRGPRARGRAGRLLRRRDARGAPQGAAAARPDDRHGRALDHPPEGRARRSPRTTSSRPCAAPGWSTPRWSRSPRRTRRTSASSRSSCAV